MRPAAVSDWRLRAQKRLPHVLFEYIDGGSYSESTLRRNVDDFDHVALRQRILTDVSQLSLSTEVCGESLSMPIILAPVGMAGLFARRGEVQAARVAEKMGVPFTLSTVSICPIEEVRAARETPFWFQLYTIKNRPYMEKLIQRAKESGARVLVFTVDLPAPGARYRDLRSGLAGNLTSLDKLRRSLNALQHPGWMWDVMVKGGPQIFGNIADDMSGTTGLNEFVRWIIENFDPAASWDDFAWVRELWEGPIIVKGILDAEDARRAADMGADAIVVSNHGGRQLDGVPSGIAALPSIAQVVGDRLTVLMDGGVRSGLDVLKALSMGAKAVLVGRAWAYALAGDGAAGVEDMLTTLRDELRAAMMLTGCTDVRQAGEHLLVRDR